MANDEQKCCVFIDNSNLFIEGQKFYARHKNLMVSVSQDIRFRIDIGRMVQALLQGREMIFATLYGSEPPPNDSLWKEIRNRGIRVKTFQRNSQNYEKELDNSLSADVSEQSCVLPDPTGSVTFIIIGGDRDYRPASKKVLKHRWKLEIVAWKTCLSREVRNFVHGNKDKDVSLTLLDSLAADNPDIYYLADKWTEQKRLPRERTIAFEYEKPVEDKEAKQLSSEVTDLIRFPCWYMHRPKIDPNIVLIIIITDQKKGSYNTSTLCTKMKAKFSNKCKRIVDFVTFLQEKYPRCQNDVPFDYDDVDEEEKDKSKHSQTHEDLGGAGTERGGAEGGGDEQVDSWTLIPGAKQKKRKQKFSEQCSFRFACRHGLNCHKAHTEAEKEHFKNHPDMLGKPYKAQVCIHAVKNKCKHQQNSKQCCYAHNESEVRCYNCDPGGFEGVHWMDECPNKRS